MRIFSVLVSGLAICTLVPLLRSQDTHVVATILELSGPVYLQMAGGGELKLDARKDKGRVLSGDVTLRCGPGGTARIQTLTDVRTIREADNRVFLGELQLQKSTSLEEKYGKVLEELRNYGLPGASRGGERATGIYSPSDQSAVRLNKFQIRWIPLENNAPVFLSLETTSGKHLWASDQLNGAGGKPSAVIEIAARKALEDEQSGRGASTFSLVLREVSGVRRSVTFSLLSQKNEEEVSRALGEWEQTSDPLFRTIGRAYVLRHARLMAETAEEYEDALKLAPGSITLLNAAIDANEKSGNTARANELKKALAGTK